MPAKVSGSDSTPRGATKARILDVAIDLFAQDGYSAVSIRDIAARVGIKESSIYRHFRAKEQILTAVFEEFAARFWAGEAAAASIEGMLNTAPPQEIFLSGLAFFKSRLQDPRMGKIWRILAMEQYRFPAAREIVVKGMVERTLGFLERLFAAMLARGLIKPYAPALLAVEYQNPLFYLSDEYCLLRYAGQDTAEVERQMEAHARFFWEMIRAEGRT